MRTANREANRIAGQRIRALFTVQLSHVRADTKRTGAAGRSGVVRELGRSLINREQQHRTGTAAPRRPGRIILITTESRAEAAGRLKTQDGRDDFFLASLVAGTIRIITVHQIVEIIIDVIDAVFFAVRRILTNRQQLTTRISAVGQTVLIVVLAVFAVGFRREPTGGGVDAVGIIAVDGTVFVIIQTVVAVGLAYRFSTTGNAVTFRVVAVHETILIIIDAVVADLGPTVLREVAVTVRTVHIAVVVVVDEVVTDLKT